MTHTNETIILKTNYYYSAFEKRMCIELEQCVVENQYDTIYNLSEMHVYKRVAKRCESIARDNTDNYDIEICDILTSIIVTDFNMSNCREYNDDFIDSLHEHCFHVEYDTVDYTLIQLC